MSDTFPVIVEVPKSDGSTERVRVGTATRIGAGFTITLTVQTGKGDVAAAPPAQASGGYASSGPTGPEPTNFPPYGRSKGMPIRGATMNDLEFYANGSRRSLGDPAKARFHDKERAMLAAIEAEIARQRGGGSAGDDAGGSDGPPPHTDEDAPF